MIKTPGNPSFRSWRAEIPIKSRYTAGVAGQMFLSALRDKGKIVGSRCTPCAQVYVPARQFCERCFAELVEVVEIEPRGRLMSFTLCYVDHDGKNLRRPIALALVQLDGATTFLLHRILDVTEPSQVKIGAPVKVVIKAKSKRKGSILDIEGFRLI